MALIMWKARRLGGGHGTHTPSSSPLITGVNQGQTSEKKMDI